jgi:hypothetical protein
MTGESSNKEAAGEIKLVTGGYSLTILDDYRK